jgi:hypothetical protein
MRKVVVGTMGAVTLLLAVISAGNAEAAPLRGCCNVAGIPMCGMACWGHQKPAPPPSRCCKLYGKWHCPCPPPPH